MYTNAYNITLDIQYFETSKTTLYINFSLFFYFTHNLYMCLQLGENLYVQVPAEMRRGC